MCVCVCVCVCVRARSYIIPDSDCSVWRLFGVLVYLNLCASGMLDSSQVAVVLPHHLSEYHTRNGVLNNI